MFDHVTIRASDRAASERFYDTVLATIGLGKTYSDEDFAEWRSFSLAEATDDKPVTRRLHIAFHAATPAEVDDFWRVGTEAGYRDDGPPGPRPEYTEDYYGAFLLDPDGNSAEAVNKTPVRRTVDHLWIRVRDLDTARRFYETVAPYTGFELGIELEDRVHFRGADASFALVAGGEATENVHLAFPARDNATVEAFHRAATAAGYGDNGPPGERSIYHAGYYGAFVLDPDGNNVEVVNHNRDT